MPKNFEIICIFAFLFTQPYFAYFIDAIYDSLNEGALLRCLVKSQCPCFEK